MLEAEREEPSLDNVQRSSQESPGNAKSFDSEIDINAPLGWFGGRLSLGFWWMPTSMSLLREAEKKILTYVKTGFRGRYINVGPIGHGSGKNDCKIWTLSMNETSQKTPLVLLHGLGSGVALWALNLDGLTSSQRPVHALDLPGFGRSSRPQFSTDGMTAENEFVDAIEVWRHELNLEKFVLLGHSMGGFLASSYAIRFPHRVAHLVLADPWGFPERPSEGAASKYPIPVWVKVISLVLQPLNPLWGIRVAGPLGPKLIEKVRPDLIKKFSSLTDDNEADIANYIFHCNAQNPTGESAFHAMTSNFGWAKFPMGKRMTQLHPDVPLTMIYGSRSWVDSGPGDIIKLQRPNSIVEVHSISGAGHHVYADKPEKFNEIVLKACEWSENNQPPCSPPTYSTTATSNESDHSTNS